MGFFDSITGGSLLGAGASIFSGILGAESASDTNAAMLNAQRELRDTQYQSAVEDMKKAGLNPMLATKLGGNMASSVPNLTPPASAGIQSAQNSAATSKLMADTQASNSQTELNHALAAKTMADARLTTANARNAEWQAEQNDFLKATGDYLPMIGREMYARSAKALLDQTNYDRDYKAADALDRFAWSEGYKNFPDAVQHLEFRSRLYDVKQQSLDIPRGEAMSEFWKSDFGRNVAPMLNSAQSMERIGSGIVGTGINLFRGKPPVQIFNKR